jgi:hypothetical protein
VTEGIPSELTAQPRARRGTARQLLHHIAAGTPAGGVLACTLADLAAVLGVTTAAVTKTLQRLAHDGVELRVPYAVGADGRPVYAAPGRPLRLRLPATVDTMGRVDTLRAAAPRVDTSRPQSAGQARVDTRPPSAARVDTCPSCGGITAGQPRVDTRPPLAMPPPTGVGTTPAHRRDAASRTLRRLDTGGWRDWDPTGGRRGRGTTRYRCDTHAHLPAADPGGRCSGCRDVRLAATPPDRHRPAGPAAGQRPLWPAAAAPAEPPATRADTGVRRDQVTDLDELARRDAARAAAVRAAAPRPRRHTRTG